MNITDPNQPAGPAKVTAGGSLFVDGAAGLDRFELLKASEFWGAAAQGLIPGASVVNKFGRLPAIGTGDVFSVWPGNSIYPFQSGTFTLEGLSSSPVDSDALGTGMQEVTVQGLDANWVEIEQTWLTNGAGVVAITGTWRRVFRAFGSDGVTNVGNITIRVTGAGDDQAIIEATYGQTYQSVYTVPVGKTAQVLDWRAEITDANITAFGEAGLFTRFLDPDLPFRSRDTTGAAAGAAPRTLLAPIILPAKTDIDLRVVSVSANGLTVVGAFTLGILDVAA